jgi:hypothetical protein
LFLEATDEEDCDIPYATNAISPTAPMKIVEITLGELHARAMPLAKRKDERHRGSLTIFLPIPRDI